MGQQWKKMRWDVLVERLPKNIPIQGAEIGVWEGQMSEHLLYALPGLTLALVDRWVPPKPDDSYATSGDLKAACSVERFKAAKRKTIDRMRSFSSYRYTILAEESTRAALYFSNGSLDFVFIDADHSYIGCLADIRAWLPKVRSGGWIGGHDFGTTYGFGVDKAVLKVFNKESVEVDDNHTWFVKVV